MPNPLEYFRHCLPGQRDLDEAEAGFDRIEKMVERLKSDNAVLREALAWYADLDNWRWTMTARTATCSKAWSDEGDIARRAIQQVDAEEKESSE